MPDLKVYLKNRLSELSAKFRVNTELSVLAVKKNDYKAVKGLYSELTDILTEIMNMVKLTEKAEYIKKVKHLQTDKLPDYMQSLTIVDAYKKLLSLKYTGFKSDNYEETISVNKMSIDFKYDEDIPYLLIGRILYENGKYVEALKLCSYIETITTTAPVWSLYGDIYRKLGEYGKAIHSYLKYLELNEDDEEGKQTLAELYEEALK